MKPTMKRNILALAAAGAIALGESPGPEIGADGLGVALFEQWMRNERFGGEDVGYVGEEV